MSADERSSFMIGWLRITPIADIDEMIHLMRQFSSQASLLNKVDKFHPVSCLSIRPDWGTSQALSGRYSVKSRGGTGVTGFSTLTYRCLHHLTATLLTNIKVRQVIHVVGKQNKILSTC
jgi:hypothetical protein